MLNYANCSPASRRLRYDVTRAIRHWRHSSVRSVVPTLQRSNSAVHRNAADACLCSDWRQLVYASVQCHLSTTPATMAVPSHSSHSSQSSCSTVQSKRKADFSGCFSRAGPRSNVAHGRRQSSPASNGNASHPDPATPERTEPCRYVTTRGVTTGG